MAENQQNRAFYAKKINFLTIEGQMCVYLLFWSFGKFWPFFEPWRPF